MQEYEVVISLGTNLGDKLKNLKTALNNIEVYGIILCESRIFCSEPWSYDSQNEFLNMGLVIKTSLEPMQLLKKLKSIEKQMVSYLLCSETYSLDIRTIETLKIITSIYHNNLPI